MNDERIGKFIPEKPEAGHLDGEAERLRLDIDDADFEQIARLGAVDVHRTGERVRNVEVHRGDVGGGRAGGDLAIERVQRLENDPLARLGTNDRRDIGMPAVVADRRLLRQRLGAIDADSMDVSGDGHGALPK